MTTYAIGPVAKPRMTRRDKWAQRDCVMQYRAFKDLVRFYKIVLPQPCKVVFVLPMPGSWSKRKRAEMVGAAHQSKPDIDNLQKGLLDALYTDDAHVWSIWAEKRWGTTGRIEVGELAEATA